MRQSGSISKFQWERLLGSFHSMTASTTARPPLTDVDLVFRMSGDFEAGAAQHGFCAGAVRNPPVSGIVRIAPLDEIHSRISRIQENLLFRERVIAFDPGDVLTTPQHRLKDQNIACYMFVY